MISLEPPSKSALSKPALVRFVTRARKLAGVGGQVDVLLTDDATMQRLNRSFRGKNKATDVLSFPAYDFAPQGGTPKGGAAKHAGDLAISLEIARRQAKALGHSLEDEIRILILHGVLHLAGMDHEADKGEMAAREAELRGELRLPVNLIARVKKTAKTKAGPSAPLRDDKLKRRGGAPKRGIARKGVRA